MKHQIALLLASATTAALTTFVGRANAATLPPLPDDRAFASVQVSDDTSGNGFREAGGLGTTEVSLSGTFLGDANDSFALVTLPTSHQVANGTAPIGLIDATVSSSGTDAPSAVATLEYWFRDTERQPFPLSLLGLPVPLSFQAQADVIQSPSAKGAVYFGSDIQEVSQETLVLNTLTGDTGFKTTVDALPDSVYFVYMSASATPSCLLRVIDNRLDNCGSSVAVDPIISFDQQAFDQLAAERGVPSVPLDQYFSLDFSPGLDQLPPIPSDLPSDVQMQIDDLLGSTPGSGPAIPEPSSLALLLIGLGTAAFARWRA